MLYRNYFSEKTKFSIIEKPNYSVPNYWLNIVDLKSRKQKINFLKTLLKYNIEARPVWKCNHLQKPYLNCETFKITNALKIVDNYLCLPSSYFLKKKHLKKIFKIFK